MTRWESGCRDPVTSSPPHPSRAHFKLVINHSLSRCSQRVMVLFLGVAERFWFCRWTRVHPSDSWVKVERLAWLWGRSRASGVELDWHFRLILNRFVWSDVHHLLFVSLILVFFLQINSYFCSSMWQVANEPPVLQTWWEEKPSKKVKRQTIPLPVGRLPASAFLQQHSALWGL